MVLTAVGQICSTASMSHNLAQCRTLVQKAVSAGAKILFLPEAADYVGSSPDESLSLCKSVSESPFVLGLQEEARKHSLPINVGIHEPLDHTDKKMKNTLVWIDEKGEITQRYQKLHMMDLEMEDGPNMREADTVEAGNEIVTPFDTAIGKVGLAVCYDLRFPELALSLKRQKADVIVYPSAFAPDTGVAHWHALLRARAIENQTYVLAAAQVGPHNKERSSYGHSVIISPWGEILAELSGVEEMEKKGDAWEPEIALADVDFDTLKRIRDEMPLARRTDVYPEV